MMVKVSEAPPPEMGWVDMDNTWPGRGFLLVNEGSSTSWGISLMLLISLDGVQILIAGQDALERSNSASE